MSLEKSHFLNDKLYSDSKARVLFRRGYSLKKITHSLRSKGIEQENIKLSLDKIISDKSDPDYISAMKICKKRRIGPMRIHSNREIFYKKDIGILARSGFNFEVSRRVMELEKDEYLKIINLL